MATVTCEVFVDGAAIGEDLSLEAAQTLARRRGGTLWVSVRGAGEDEVRATGDALGLSSIGVAGMLRRHERSRLDQWEDQYFLTLQPAVYDDDAETVECHEVGVVVTDDTVLVLASDDALDVDALRAGLDRHPEIVAHGPLGIVWAVCETVTRDYGEVLDGIENDIDQIEEELFGNSEGVTRRIFALQREVIDLQHAVTPLPDMFARLETVVAPKRDAPSPAFQALADRARYVDTRVAAFRQTLDSALTVHSALVAQHQNETMLRESDQTKKISSWAAIGFAPTLVAGIYGMNFVHMPELAQVWGYPAALGLMVAVSAGLYVLFKRRNWL